MWPLELKVNFQVNEPVLKCDENVRNGSSILLVIFSDGRKSQLNVPVDYAAVKLLLFLFLYLLISLTQAQSQGCS